MNPIERHRIVMDQFAIGHEWQKYAAAFFELNGLPVHVPELEVRQAPSTDPYENERGDLWIGDILLDVKTTFVRFTYPGDFKYPAPMVDTVHGFETKAERPRVYVVVSRPMGTMMWISVKESFDYWIRQRKYDTVMQTDRTFFLCDKKWWHPIDELVATLKAELKIN